MSTYLHLIIKNFRWRIESISPTSDLVRQLFRFWDPTYEEDEDESSGFSRSFYVEWNGSEPDSAATDADRREAWHRFTVNLIYPVTLNYQDMHVLIAQDRHDVIETLRADENRVGYDDNNSTTELGLYNRYCDGDDLIKEENIWILAQRYRCLIEESEQ